MTELTKDDLHAVMALVRETLERWHDPSAWREYLLRGMCVLTQSHIAAIAGTSLPKPGRFGHPEPIAIVGMPEPLRKSIFEAALTRTQDASFEEVERTSPGFTSFFVDFERQGWATATRADMTDDAAYYASSFHQKFRKHAGCDDYIMSARAVDEPARVEVLTIDRPPAAPRFTARDRLLIKIIHDEIAPLVGVRLTTEAHLSTDGLSNRLRETLSLLLDGKSEKQVAKTMGLALSTVHSYVTILYRHFQVASRPELMAYFIHRTPRSPTNVS